MIDYSKISFHPLDECMFIHQYHVPNLHNILLKYKVEIFKNISGKEEEHLYKPGKANIEVKSKVVRNIVISVNSYIADHFYYLKDSYYRDAKIGAYIQDNKSNISVFHTHWQGTLVSTLYLDPPNEGEGGEFEIVLPPNDSFKIQPKKDYIYFIPGWLLHRPLPQTTTIPRVCINWVENSMMRPIHKLTGQRW